MRISTYQAQILCANTLILSNVLYWISWKSVEALNPSSASMDNFGYKLNGHEPMLADEGFNLMYPRSFLFEKVKIEPNAPSDRTLWNFEKAIWESRFIGFLYRMTVIFFYNIHVTYFEASGSDRWFFGGSHHCNYLPLLPSLLFRYNLSPFSNNMRRYLRIKAFLIRINLFILGIDIVAFFIFAFYEYISEMGKVLQVLNYSFTYSKIINSKFCH